MSDTHVVSSRRTMTIIYVDNVHTSAMTVSSDVWDGFVVEYNGGMAVLVHSVAFGHIYAWKEENTA